MLPTQMYSHSHPYSAVSHSQIKLLHYERKQSILKPIAWLVIHQPVSDLCGGIAKCGIILEQHCWASLHDIVCWTGKWNLLQWDTAKYINNWNAISHYKGASCAKRPYFLCCCGGGMKKKYLSVSFWHLRHDKRHISASLYPCLGY